jgi:hypothetical protein
MVLYTCNQYPVRKLILVGDKVEEIFLWKSPTNGVPPITQSSTASNKQNRENNRDEKKNP